MEPDNRHEKTHRTEWEMATPYVVVANLLLWRAIVYCSGAEGGEALVEDEGDPRSADGNRRASAPAGSFSRNENAPV